MNRTYLFVYGTLRKEFGLPLLKQIEQNLVWVGCGTVKGLLYDLGPYPGAVERATRQIIDGEVYVVEQPETVFKVLDEYEGEKFRRGTTNVGMKTGDSIIASIYWYTGSTANARSIEQNDYLKYLKNKKDRFL